MVDQAQLAELFERLCDAPRAERDEVLAQLEDDALRERLRALLEADLVASKVLSTGPGRDGAALLAADLVGDSIPEWVGRFRVLRRLGAGAMGVVYEAEQDHPRRVVALKLLHPWLRSEVALELFRFEAQALGQVTHPRIPVVYEAGEAEGVAYLSMEKIEGMPLLEWSAGASIEERVQLLVAVAYAVDAAHEAGLVHRDLKPGNILVGEDGPTLLDFGVAAPLLSRQVGSQPGTPLYMSPEQASGEAVGPASDLFSLGTIAYQLLTGELPVQSGSMKELAVAKRSLPVRADRLLPEVDCDVARVVQWALQPRVSDRPLRARDWAAELKRALRSEPLRMGPNTVRYRGARFVRRHRAALRLAVAVGGLGLVGLAAAWGWGAWSEAARWQTAARHQQRMMESATAALGDANPDAAERLLKAFVADPQHQGTAAVVSSWLWWAKRQEERDRALGLGSLAEAWLAATDAASVDEVAAALASRFQRDSRWSELWRLREVMGPAARAHARPLLREAAIARRDFEAARALGGDSSMLTALSVAQKIPVKTPRAYWFDVDQDGVYERLNLLERRALLTDALGDVELGVIDHSAEVGYLSSDHFVVKDGELWGATQDRGGRLTAYGLDPDGLHELRTFGGVGEGRILDLERLDGELWLGMGYPNRDIIRYNLTGSSAERLESPTDTLHSDVMAILPADLDGDGVEEVVVALGAWAAYEVRVLRRTSDGYVVAGRLPLGTVSGLARVPRVGKSPLIVATKGDFEKDLRAFSAEAPFGEPAGLYLLEWTGSLHQVGFVPLPIRDGIHSGPEQVAGEPKVGDINGDGKLDLVTTLENFDVGPLNLVWVLSDVLGARDSYVLAGLRALDLADLDHDGDAELLVSDEGEQLWAVGLGDAKLPVWDRELVKPNLPPVPTDDVWVQRGWKRAEQLVSIGLPAEATQALSVLPGLSERPAARSAATVAAATLLAASGDPDRAEPLYAEAFSADPTNRAIGLGLLRARLGRLDYAGARSLQERLHVPDFDWLSQVGPRVRVLDAAHLEGWALHRPGVFTVQEGTLRVHAFNDHGLLATRQVRVEGPVIGLRLSMVLESLELASGLAVDLVGGPDAREILVGVWGQGGGGLTKAYKQCASTKVQVIGKDELEVPRALDLWAVRSSAESLLRCRTRSVARKQLPTWEARSFEPGIYTLRLRAWGVPDYNAPTGLRAAIQSLDVVGMTPVETDKTPAERGRAALFRGEQPQGLPAEEDAWAALAAGDAADMRQAVGELWARGDRMRLRWLLRTRGEDVVPVLEEVAGTGFPALFLQAWREASGPLTEQTQTELLRPPLRAIPASDPAGAELRLLRGRIRLLRGERSRARVLALSVREGARDPELVRRALLLLAKSSPAEAEGAIEAAMALDREKTVLELRRR